MEDYKEELRLVEDELSVVEVEIQQLLERQQGLLERQTDIKAILDQQSRTAKSKKNKTWDGTDFPWTTGLEESLRSVFHLTSLRPMQRQTMNASMSGEDALLIMPTGGGKSLCFQLPAVVNKGLTLVVSPLVSLMEDQVMALEELDVPAAMLNAATDKDRVKQILEDMVQPSSALRLLYVTPEKLAKSKRFMNKLEKCYAVGNLSRLVIDEVHCCSQWGHDFRPDYKFLGIMKRQFPDTPILGLTATATSKVLEDVKKILAIQHAIVFKASFNRPNLFYEVQEKPNTQKDTMEKIAELINTRFRGMSGIVYCFSRKETEEVTFDLISRGVRAGCYHADVDPKLRSRVHRQWLAGELTVVCATVAFGMGIDKPDVRFVIHHSISKSMENLYQESGRAGRDEKRSDCIVLYRLADVARQSSMVFTEQTGLHNLHGIVKYCTDVISCRRSIIARHFGEVWDSGHCQAMCDHCKRGSTQDEVEKKDVSDLGRDLLTLLESAGATEQRVTLAKLTDAWYGRGVASLKVKSVPKPGIGQDAAERILAHMLVEGYLREDFHFTAYSTICYIVPGPKAKMLRTKATKVFMNFATSTSKSPGSKNHKPALVVINKDKSHFSSMPSASVSAKPQKTASIKSSKGDSSNGDGGDIHNDMPLHFDDSDEDWAKVDMSNRTKKQASSSSSLTKNKKNQAQSSSSLTENGKTKAKAAKRTNNVTGIVPKDSEIDSGVIVGENKLKKKKNIKRISGSSESSSGEGTQTFVYVPATKKRRSIVHGNTAESSLVISDDEFFDT